METPNIPKSKSRFVRPAFLRSQTTSKIQNLSINTSGRRFSTPSKDQEIKRKRFMGKRRCSISSIVSDPPTPEDNRGIDYSKFVKASISPLHTPLPIDEQSTEDKMTRSKSFRSRRRDHFSVRSRMRRGNRKSLSAIFEDSLVESSDDSEDEILEEQATENTNLFDATKIKKKFSYPLFRNGSMESKFLLSFYQMKNVNTYFILGFIVNLFFIIESLLHQPNEFYEESEGKIFKKFSRFKSFVIFCLGIFTVHLSGCVLINWFSSSLTKRTLDLCLLLILTINTILENASLLLLIEVGHTPILIRLVFRFLFLRARFHVHLIPSILQLILLVFVVSPISLSYASLSLLSAMLLFKKFRSEQFLRHTFDISVNHKKMQKNCEETYQQHHELLCNIMPGDLVRTCQRNHREGKKQLVSKYYKKAAVVSLDIAGFTRFSQSIHPKYLIHMLNEVYLKFDQIAQEYHVEKVKTIGDEYIVLEWETDTAFRSICFGIDALNWFKDFCQRKNVPDLILRGGLGHGNVIGFVYGRRSSSISFDVFGNAADEAERNQQKSVNNLLCVSSEELLRDNIHQVMFLEKKAQQRIRARGERKRPYSKVLIDIEEVEGEDDDDDDDENHNNMFVKIEKESVLKSGDSHGEFLYFARNYFNSTEGVVRERLCSELSFLSNFSTIVSSEESSPTCSSCTSSEEDQSSPPSPSSSNTTSKSSQNHDPRNDDDNGEDEDSSAYDSLSPNDDDEEEEEDDDENGRFLTGNPSHLLSDTTPVINIKKTQNFWKKEKKSRKKRKKKKMKRKKMRRNSHHIGDTSPILKMKNKKKKERSCSLSSTLQLSNPPHHNNEDFGLVLQTYNNNNEIPSSPSSQTDRNIINSNRLGRIRRRMSEYVTATIKRGKKCIKRKWKKMRKLEKKSWSVHEKMFQDPSSYSRKEYTVLNIFSLIFVDFFTFFFLFIILMNNDFYYGNNNNNINNIINNDSKQQQQQNYNDDDDDAKSLPNFQSVFFFILYLVPLMLILIKILVSVLQIMIPFFKTYVQFESLRLFLHLSSVLMFGIITQIIFPLISVFEKNESNNNNNNNRLYRDFDDKEFENMKILLSYSVFACLILLTSQVSVFKKMMFLIPYFVIYICSSLTHELISIFLWITAVPSDDNVKTTTTTIFDVISYECNTLLFENILCVLILLGYTTITHFNWNRFLLKYERKSSRLTVETETYKREEKINEELLYSTLPKPIINALILKKKLNSTDPSPNSNNNNNNEIQKNNRDDSNHHKKFEIIDNFYYVKDGSVCFVNLKNLHFRNDHEGANERRRRKSCKLEASMICEFLYLWFTRLDSIIKKLKHVFKLKSTKFSFVSISGLTYVSKEHHQKSIIEFARLALLSFHRVKERFLSEKFSTCSKHNKYDEVIIKQFSSIEVGIGIHSGGFSCGIVGEKKLKFDAFGNTLNLSCRMAQTAKADQIHFLKHSLMSSWKKVYPDSDVIVRMDTFIKGKGKMNTFAACFGEGGAGKGKNNSNNRGDDPSSDRRRVSPSPSSTTSSISPGRDQIYRNLFDYEIKRRESVVQENIGTDNPSPFFGNSNDKNDNDKALEKEEEMKIDNNNNNEDENVIFNRPMQMISSRRRRSVCLDDLSLTRKFISRHKERRKSICFSNGNHISMFKKQQHQQHHNNDDDEDDKYNNNNSNNDDDDDSSSFYDDRDFKNCSSKSSYQERKRKSRRNRRRRKRKEFSRIPRDKMKDFLMKGMNSSSSNNNNKNKKKKKKKKRKNDGDEEEEERMKKRKGMKVFNPQKRKSRRPSLILDPRKFLEIQKLSEVSPTNSPSSPRKSSNNHNKTNMNSEGKNEMMSGSCTPMPTSENVVMRNKKLGEIRVVVV